MAEAEGGWIKLYRKLQQNDLWTSEPFTRGQAWVDLLLLSNHKDGFIRVRGIKIDIKRGQVGWSEQKLAERWKWSRTKVRTFILELQKEQQIEQQKNFKSSVMTIVNYEEYQQKEQQEEQEKEHQKDSRKTAEEQQKDTNKNVKNEKNEKKNTYAEFVSMTTAEYQKLIDEYGIDNTEKFITTIDNYKGANGKKYKSDYRAILNWVVEKVLGKNDGSNQLDKTQSTLDRMHQIDPEGINANRQ